MKRLVLFTLALAALFAASTAHADEWWFVNVRDGQQPACIKVRDTPENMVTGMNRVWGAANVRSVKQAVHVGGEPSGKLLGNIFTIVVTTPDGPGQFPFTSSQRACDGAIQRVVAAELSLTKARQEIAAGTRQSAYKPPHEPWYLLSYKLGRCTLLSDGFPGANTPQQLVEQFARVGERMTLRPGGDEGVFLMYHTSGNVIGMVQGADKCKIAMALTKDAR